MESAFRGQRGTRYGLLVFQLVKYVNTSTMTSFSAGVLAEDQWNLDPLFRTFPKLFIRDILSMPPYSTAHTGTDFTRAFNYNNHPIINTDVLGVIVRRHKREKCTIYDLDDGTGVLSCLCWLQSVSQQSDPHGDDLDLPPELLRKSGQVSTLREKVVDGFNIGDLLHVRGKIKVFNGMRELMCSYHAVEEDVNAETLRMVELVQCYRKFYDKPFLLAQDDGDKAFDVMSDSLRRLVETHLQEKRPHRISADHIRIITGEELSSVEELPDSAIKQLLASLELEGIIYKSPSNTDYLVTDSNVDLRNTILKILKRECRKSKYEECGCPVVRVIDELRALLPYVHLQRASVSRALQTLEENSEVISLEPHHYQALDF